MSGSGRIVAGGSERTSVKFEDLVSSRKDELIPSSKFYFIRISLLRSKNLNFIGTTFASKYELALGLHYNILIE